MVAIQGRRRILAMKHLVCKNKDDGKRFITNRTAREIMLSTHLDLGLPIDSVVEKEFDTLTEAVQYKEKMDKTDKDINNILK